MDEDEFEDLEEEEQEEEEDLDPTNPDHAFILLERDFNRVVTELEQNPTIAPYAEDFSKIFEALYNTNEKRKELIENVQELDDQIVETNEKLDNCMKSSEADAVTMGQLKEKIDYACRLADAAHEREQQAQEIIENLRREIAALTMEIEFKNKLAGDQDPEAAQEMSKNQEGLERERDKLAGEVNQLQLKLTNAMGYQEELERKNSQADVKINEMQGQLDDKSGELDKSKKYVDELEGDIKDLNSEMIRLNRNIIELQNQVQKDEKLNSRLERHLQDMKNQKEKMLKDMEILTQKFGKLQDDHTALISNNDQTRKELHKINNELKLKEGEGLRMTNEINKFQKIRENYDKKLGVMDAEKLNIANERDKIRGLYTAMEKEVTFFRKQADLDKRTMDGMNREKDVLNKNIIRQQAVVRDYLRLIQIQEQTKKKLEVELEEYAFEGDKQKKQIGYLEKERDRMVDEQLDLTKKIEDMLDDMKIKKAELYDMKKSLAENETKLKMQQSLFESVRAERNGLQKLLQESNSECGELKNKLKISSHQSEQLKEDIAMKEQQLIREENILRKMTKEKDNLRVELDNAFENIKHLKETINEMSEEEKRLHKVISNNDRKIKQLTKDLEQLMNERDILGSQLVRRNDELGLLYQKIKILQTTMQRGEAYYERRLEDIRLLKIEVKRLRQEKILLTKSIHNMTDLRQEVFHLQRDLTRERLKARALEEEVQNPLNIHRWRKLEGSDPTVIELLKKLQLLQKRLIQQATEAIERERQLKEAERLYMNLRQVLVRQPGPDIKNDLIKTQRALTLRGNKMKCLVSELNMSEQQAVEYKLSLDKVRSELKSLKNKYLIEKKAQQRRLEAMKLNDSQATNRTVKSDSQIKFSGGGFKMSIHD